MIFYILTAGTRRVNKFFKLKMFLKLMFYFSILSLILLVHSYPQFGCPHGELQAHDGRCIEVFSKKLLIKRVWFLLQTTLIAKMKFATFCFVFFFPIYTLNAVTIKKHQIFDTPEVCPGGQLQNHNGDCEVPFKLSIGNMTIPNVTVTTTSTVPKSQTLESRFGAGHKKTTVKPTPKKTLKRLLAHQ
jgi:hypothetical protein